MIKKIIDAILNFYKKITPMWVVVIAFIISLVTTWFTLDGNFGIVVPDNVKTTVFYNFIMSSEKNKFTVNLLCIFFSRSVLIAIFMFLLPSALDDGTRTITYYSDGTSITSGDEWIFICLIFGVGVLYLPAIPCFIGMCKEIVIKIIEYREKRIRQYGKYRRYVR